MSTLLGMMSSFWNTSAGDTINVSADADGVETGKLIRIPDMTKVLGVARKIEPLNVQEGREDEAMDGFQLGWKVEWEIIQDGEYKGHAVRGGLKVYATKDKQRNEAISAVSFLDNYHNGGQLQASGVEPDMDAFLAAIEGKPTVLLIRAQASKDAETGEERFFNWVGGYFRAPGAAAPNKEAAAARAMAQVKAQEEQKKKREEAQRKAKEAAEAAAEAARLAEMESEAAAQQGNPEDTGAVMQDDDIPY